MPDGGPEPRFAPWLAALFCAAAVATVPVGFTLPSLAYLALGTFGVIAVVAARLEAPGRWQDVCIWPVAVILGSIAASAAAGPDPAQSIARFATMPLFALLFPAAQVAAWRTGALRLVFAAGAVALLAMAIDFTVNAGTPPRRGALAIAGSLGNANDATAAAMLVPLATAALPAMPTPLGSRLAAATVSLVPVARSGSRQALLALLVTVAQPTLTRLTWRRAIGVLAVAIVITAAAVAASPRLRGKLATTFDKGLGYRATLVAFGMTRLHEAPVLGHGPGLFGRSHAAGVQEGWTWRGHGLRPIGMPWIHCLPLEIAFELGAVGVAAFAAVGTATIRRLRRPGGNAPGAPPCPSASAAAAMLAAFAVVGLIDLTLLKDWVRCLLWLAAGLAFAGPVPSSNRTDSRGIAVAEPG